jgi:hypothetical protein
VILPKPYGEGLPADAPVIVEAAMFQGLAPVVVLAVMQPTHFPRSASSSPGTTAAEAMAPCAAPCRFW